jgi:polyhydroxybutyrate depolymerase
MGRPLSLKQEYLRDLLILAVLALGVFIFIKIKTSTPNETEQTLTSSGETRSYLLYVPDSYQRSTPAALVIALHGYSSKPSDMAYTSRWNDLADQEGFIVAYPRGSGSPTYWRSSATTYAPDSSQGDVQFISDLIDQLEAEYNIDTARIYVNGMSMGGGMSYVLACRLANRIAAVGGVAGAYSYPLNLCNPSRPVPFIAFHGTEDATVSYEGETLEEYNLTFPPILPFIEGLAEINQCAQSTATPREEEISITNYTGCAQDAEVILYTIHGGGHTWPGDPSGTTTQWGRTTQQIDATLLMWEFFEQHPLAAQ